MCWWPPIPRRKKLKLIGDCPKYILEFSCNVCIKHELVDLKFFSQSTNLHVRSGTGPSKPSTRLISFLRPSHDWIQIVMSWENAAQQCRLELFQDSDFAGDLEDSKSISDGTLCIFGSIAFVPISWMCKKQTSASHSSSDSWFFFAWYRFPHGRQSRAWFLGFDHWCTAFKREEETEI